MNPVRGKKYNWISQPERLVYLGVSGRWHQFALVDEPDKVWCEVLNEHMHMLEETVDNSVDSSFFNWLTEEVGANYTAIYNGAALELAERAWCAARGIV